MSEEFFEGGELGRLRQVAKSVEDLASVPANRLDRQMGAPVRAGSVDSEEGQRQIQL